jgi:hypothetical protein
MAQTIVGTPHYLSPEMCDNQPYGRKVRGLEGFVERGQPRLLLTTVAVTVRGYMRTSGATKPHNNQPTN